MLVCACGGSSGGVGPGPVGMLLEKPGGGYFVSDPNLGGNARELHLVEVVWGRLVDIHDVDELGRTNPVPVLRDMVVDENILTDGVDYELTTNPITRRTRLVILRPRTASDTGTGTFESLLHRATSTLAPILPKNDDGTASEPFSLVARNAALLVRFDDLLEDGTEARADLPEMVRLGAGYPPRTPFPARLLFDTNHGGLSGGEFHSTRVIVDLTVSEEEAAELPPGVPVNTLGLPASSELTRAPSSSLRFPTRLDFEAGRFTRLRNLVGRTLVEEGPVDAGTHDLVRAMRAGNATDSNGGFLLDLDRPRIVGAFELALDSAVPDPAGPEGFGFLVDLDFSSCRAAPQAQDVLVAGGELLEVVETAGLPDAEGRVAAVRVRTFATQPLANPLVLLGLGRLLTPYRLAPSIEAGCWVTFVPPARQPPVGDVPADMAVSVRFSEPMDPAFFRAFDTFRVIRGSSSTTNEIFASDLVIGDVQASSDLQEFRFVPRLPLTDRSGFDYHVQLAGGLEGVRDLGGNALIATFDRVDFTLDPSEPSHSNAGVALRFAGSDELLPFGLQDLRGQAIYDSERQLLRPRDVSFASAPADRLNQIPSLMLPFGLGVQTPLSPLGSKLQAVWRYVDLGWRVADENRHNVDVTGLSWSPVGGAIVADFYPEFEIRLAHSRQLPDETPLQSQAPRYPSSGLASGPFPYSDNILADPRGPQTVVHPRSLGYRLSPVDLFLNSHGTPVVPFPLNRGPGPLVTYTWRDTAVLAQGGAGGPGIPMDIEVGAPFFIETGVGSLAQPGHVPSIGLPLLWEIRCYPSNSGIGLNALDILLPVPGFPLPNFRAFSTGGIDSTGTPVVKNPDLELAPTGGLNPNSQPPGQPTARSADNSFYIGQVDVVVRVSRAHTIWIDTGMLAPRYVAPVMEPKTQPEGTRILLEYRGADSFSGDAGMAPFDARELDWYGDFRPGTPQFQGDGTWTEDIHAVDGARFFQVRLSFFNNIENRLSPELDSLGLAFTE